MRRFWMDGDPPTLTSLGADFHDVLERQDLVRCGAPRHDLVFQIGVAPLRIDVSRKIDGSASPNPGRIVWSFGWMKGSFPSCADDN